MSEQQLTSESRLQVTADRIDFLQRWMRTPSPLLGNVTPLDMMKLGRGEKLAQFIETQFELNGGYCSERK